MFLEGRQDAGGPREIPPPARLPYQKFTQSASSLERMPISTLEMMRAAFRAAILGKQKGEMHR